MKIKIFGCALLLSLAGFLGACESTPAPDATTPAATPGEPADTGSTPAPAAPATPAAPTTPSTP